MSLPLSYLPNSLTARAHGLDSLVHQKETIEAFIRQCKRSGLCSEDTATFAELCDTADERLFARVKGNSIVVVIVVVVVIYHGGGGGNRVGGDVYRVCCRS